MQNIEIPPGSTVVITGANGYIGSVMVKEFLERGYKVRGTVRDINRCAWLEKLYSERYGPGCLELVQISDLSDEGSYDNHFADASALLVTTSPLKMDATDPSEIIPDAISAVLAPLKAAARFPNIKSVTYTGSSWAVFKPRANYAAALTEETFNEEAVKEAYAPTFDDVEARKLAIVMATMVEKEKAMWKWVRESKPSFRFNVCLVSVTLGAITSVEHQGVPSTAGLFSMVFRNSNAQMAGKYIPPQWFVNVEDVARCHFAAAVRKDVRSERLFLYAGRFSWNEILRILRRLYPAREFGGDDPNEGVCLTTVSNQRSEQLLKDMGRSGWTGLEETVKKMTESAWTQLTA